MIIRCSESGESKISEMFVCDAKDNRFTIITDDGTKVTLDAKETDKVGRMLILCMEYSRGEEMRMAVHEGRLSPIIGQAIARPGIHITRDDSDDSDM